MQLDDASTDWRGMPRTARPKGTWHTVNVIPARHPCGRLLIRESMKEQTIGQHEYILGLREKIANKVYFVKIETSQYSRQMKLVMLR